MTLRVLAERIEQLTAQINELSQPVGIGPDSAVTLLITMGDTPSG
ncbi:hypothetical protein RKD37_002103 [Streptomyces ambofaciens]|jgi:hypothetical protein